MLPGISVATSAIAALKVVPAWIAAAASPINGKVTPIVSFLPIPDSLSPAA